MDIITVTDRWTRYPHTRELTERQSEGSGRKTE